MQTPAYHNRRPHRTWLIPAVVAAILFIGAVASNLIANYIQPRVEPYRRWVWVSFFIALIVAIGFAIREARRTTHSPVSSGEPERDAKRNGVAGDIVARDKITHIHQTTSPVATALHQLPPPVSDFTGRANELAELTAKLEQGGVTISGLHGLGGIGKTALALKLADHLKARYPDAQFYLDLKGASPEPLAVAEALAHVIRAYHPTAKLPETEGELQGLYRSLLHDQRALLLMDNAANAAQVEPLIPPVGCVLLVTSRAHFTLPGVFAKNLEALSLGDARELLLAIAPRIGERADELAALCGRLPLALRLAGSALVKFANLTPAEYLDHLQEGQRRLELIEASLNLSYELLTEQLQKRWRLLAVFPNTFDEKAAAAVWNLDVGKGQDALGELIAASIVEWNEVTRRYRLHDLARLFAGSRVEIEERTDGQRILATYYRTVLADANVLYLKGGESVRRGLTVLGREWRNIEAGQAWAAAEAQGNDYAAQLGVAYVLEGASVLELRLHPREQIRWSDVAVGAARRLKQRHNEGRALIILGIAHFDLGETRRAIEFFEQSLTIAREIGNRKSEGVAFGNLGMAYGDLGETRRAIELYEQRLIIARETNDPLGEANALGQMGQTYATLKESRRAIEFFEKQLTVVRAIGYRRGEASALGNMGLAHAHLGETRQAIELYEEALLAERELGFRRGEGYTIFNKSLALNALGEHKQAIAAAEEALAILEPIEDPNAKRVRSQVEKWQAMRR